jgi:hypothetical protein
MHELTLKFTQKAAGDLLYAAKRKLEYLAGSGCGDFSHFAYENIWTVLFFLLFFFIKNRTVPFVSHPERNEEPSKQGDRP